MKKVAHLLGYIVRRQFCWVALFWALVAAFVALIDRELPSVILVGALGAVALMIVTRIHDHLDGGDGGGVLRIRPIEKRSLLFAELAFLFGALVLPVMVGILVVLISYEARFPSYATWLVLMVFVTSQLVLWYVAGKLSKSHFGSVVLIIAHYLPVVFLWAVVEFRNHHSSIEVTVLLVLGIAGFLSLLLVVLPILPRAKVILFLGFAGALLLAMSGIEWDKGKVFGANPNELVGSPPARGEAISVEFAAAPPVDGDPMKDSHWNYLKISSDRTDEIFVPSGILGSPFTSSRSDRYRYYLWDEVDEVMLGDVILRNLPAETKLRGVETTWRYYKGEFFREEAKTVRVAEEMKSMLYGQKHRLVSVGRLPLKSGSSKTAEGYRVSVREVDYRTSKLLVKVDITWVFDALIRLERQGVQTAWVLYSPSSQRGVLTYGRTIYGRGGLKPMLIRKHWEFLEFPLPETFAGEGDLELHPFYLEEGELLRFEVSIPPGEYLVR